MAQADDTPPETIVVVRRRSGAEEDSHHGGVWKIAYADFMTAMMAFFLVMWLINAANTETKSSVASYFNPIKLTDNVARRKGLLDVAEKSNAHDKMKEPQNAKRAESSSEPTSPPERDASSPISRLSDTSRPDGDTRVLSASTGDPSTAGPFDPLGDPRTWSADRPMPTTPGDEVRAMLSRLPTDRGVAATLERETDTTTAAKHTLATIKPEPSSAAEAADAAHHHLTETRDLIRREAHAAVRRLGLVGGPGVDVSIEGDHIILSLTDTSTFGMFAVGSSDPNADLVTLLQNLSPVLALNAEALSVRGHTDGRPFRSERRNNNWRLAMARAEAAYGLLVAFGIDDLRFERIEGFADRKLKVPHDAEAAANRRIEIVIRPGAR